MDPSPIPKYQQIATVTDNRPETSAYFRLSLACQGFSNARPGQFATLRLPGLTTPLLRRPFSIHRLIRNGDAVTGIEILYKVVGDFTRALTRITSGDRVDLLGPLGNGFTVPTRFEKIILAGGGIGIAPLVFLADALKISGNDLSGSTACLGGRTADDILRPSVFESLGLSLRITTDDGSAGVQGLVTKSLEDCLSEGLPDRIYACGPMPMLRAVRDIANKNNLPCELSVETIMACGLGACLGCAVNKNETTGKYQHVCIDGPVFDASHLVF